MTSARAISGFATRVFKAPQWKLALAMLLILGQVLILNHVVLHQLEEAIAPDNDHCSFCAIGSHSAPAVAPPLLPPSPAYTIAFYLALNAFGITGFSLPLLRLRGPPSSSIA